MSNQLWCASVVSRCPRLARPGMRTCLEHGNEEKKLSAEPTSQAKAAAEEILAVPNIIGQMAEALSLMTKTMEAIDLTLCELANRMGVTIHRPVDGFPGSRTIAMESPNAPPDAPRTFFLNERHETHVTKSQVRKEQRIRREAKKAGKGKDDAQPSTPHARRSKPAARSSR